MHKSKFLVHKVLQTGIDQELRPVLAPQVTHCTSLDKHRFCSTFYNHLKNISLGNAGILHSESKDILQRSQLHSSCLQI